MINMNKTKIPPREKNGKRGQAKEDWVLQKRTKEEENPRDQEGKKKGPKRRMKYRKLSQYADQKDKGY